MSCEIIWDLTVQKFRQLNKETTVPRAGVVVLELILTAPALLIIMLSMVQISLIYVVNEQTAYASRYAAKIASETERATINTLNTGPLKASVDRVLNVGGIPLGSCRVILEHNVPDGILPVVPPLGPGPEVTVSDPAVADPDCECEPPTTALPVVPPSASGPVVFVNQSVRTTVCVPLNGNVPDLISSIGFSVQDYIVEQTTTYIYEVPLLPIPTIP
ncbi:pilus assembly protein [Gimesia maris]|nr:pilus assembly protein [Gimesia maris]